MINITTVWDVFSLHFFAWLSYLLTAQCLSSHITPSKAAVDGGVGRIKEEQNRSPSS
jgi:hypothetical protein